MWFCWDVGLVDHRTLSVNFAINLVKWTRPAESIRPQNTPQLQEQIYPTFLRDQVYGTVCRTCGLCVVAW